MKNTSKVMVKGRKTNLYAGLSGMDAALRGAMSAFEAHRRYVSKGPAAYAADKKARTLTGENQ